MLYVLLALVAGATAYYFASPYIFPPPPKGTYITLNPSSDIPGSIVTIAGKNLTAGHNITATFQGTSVTLAGTCSVDSTGALAGCSFVTPTTISSGHYNVTATDGTHHPSATFTVPSFLPPYSTILVSMTSIGLGVVTQLVTRRVVDLNAERRMKAEVGAFNKEKRSLSLEIEQLKQKSGEGKGSQELRQAEARLEKMKKRELQVRQDNAKISSARLKVTAITFVPLLGVYYLMSSFLGGFGVIVGYIPIPVPYIAGAAAANGGWQVSLFWWYFLSSFTFSSLLTRLLHTTT